jgi:hypothetical protein
MSSLLYTLSPRTSLQSEHRVTSCYISTRIDNEDFYGGPYHRILAIWFFSRLGVTIRHREVKINLNFGHSTETPLASSSDLKSRAFAQPKAQDESETDDLHALQVLVSLSHGHTVTLRNVHDLMT